MRQIVVKPSLGLGLDPDLVGGDAGFFPQLAQCGLLRGLAGVYSALRHLPGGRVIVDALPDKDMPRAVHEHHADTGAVGQFGDLFGGHGGPFLSAHGVGVDI